MAWIATEDFVSVEVGPTVWPLRRQTCTTHALGGNAWPIRSVRRHGPRFRVLVGGEGLHFVLLEDKR